MKYRLPREIIHIFLETWDFVGHSQGKLTTFQPHMKLPDERTLQYFFQFFFPRVSKWRDIDLKMEKQCSVQYSKYDTEV